MQNAFMTKQQVLVPRDIRSRRGSRASGLSPGTYHRLTRRSSLSSPSSRVLLVHRVKCVTPRTTTYAPLQDRQYRVDPDASLRTAFASRNWSSTPCSLRAQHAVRTAHGRLHYTLCPNGTAATDFAESTTNSTPAASRTGTALDTSNIFPRTSAAKIFCRQRKN